MPLRARVVRKEQNRANQHAPAAPVVTKNKRTGDRTTRATGGDENKVCSTGTASPHRPGDVQPRPPRVVATATTC